MPKIGQPCPVIAQPFAAYFLSSGTIPIDQSVALQPRAKSVLEKPLYEGYR